MTDTTATSALPSLTEATFDEVLRAEALPLLVDFWASWCPPCKLVEPVLAEIAEIHHGALRVARVDVDASPSISRRYGVMSMPTLLLFQDGEPVMRLVGARGKGQLLTELDRFV